SAASKNVACFLSTELACCPCVPAKVVDENAAVFRSDGETDSVSGVAVDPASIRNEGDDALVTNAVGGPPESAQVRVVQAVLVRAGGEFGEGVGDPEVEGGVSQVGV